MQITSLKITNSEISASLAEKLSLALRSVPHLQELHVADPIQVAALPHHPAIRSFKLQSLPLEQTNIGTWHQLKNCHGLKEIDVSFRSGTSFKGRLYVCDDKTEITLLDDFSAPNILQILDHLAMYLNKVKPFPIVPYVHLISNRTVTGILRVKLAFDQIRGKLIDK